MLDILGADQRLRGYETVLTIKLGEGGRYTRREGWTERYSRLPASYEMHMKEEDMTGSFRRWDWEWIVGKSGSKQVIDYMIRHNHNVIKIFYSVCIHGHSEVVIWLLEEKRVEICLDTIDEVIRSVCWEDYEDRFEPGRLKVL
jgi:hypothetical protein